MHVGAGGGPGGLEYFGAAHRGLNRRGGFPGQQCSQRLQVDGNLPSEPAANLHGHHLYLGDGQVQHTGQRVPGGERALRADPDGQFAVGVPECGAVLGLDVTLVHRGRGVFLLDYDVGCGEALVKVALLIAEVSGYVAVLVGGFAHLRGGLVFVEEFGVLGHRLPDLGGRLQHFVLHLDQGQGLLGVVGAGCCHGCHRVALVEDLVLRHHLAGSGAVGRYVCARDDGADSPCGLGLAGVDGLDAGVSVGAPQHFCKEDAGGLKVGSVLGAAGHLVGAVVPYRPGSDDLVVGIGQYDIGCH